MLKTIVLYSSYSSLNSRAGEQRREQDPFSAYILTSA